MTDRYGKTDDFRVHQQTPFNGAVPAGDIGETVITPTDEFYVRGHGPVPSLDAETFTLHVGGMVERPLTLTLADLQRDYPARTVEATLQCAGNRRRELHEIKPMQKNALLWEQEAISNATWTGVELSAVLRAAGVRDGAAHVAMLAADAGASPKGEPFGGSIPLEKAMMDGTLLAWAMNGEPLPPIHGAPLRAVVPGYVAARSVKWLTQITVQEQPSDNHFQAHDYKTFPIDVTEHNVDWTGGTMLNEHATHAAFVSPASGARVRPGKTTARGYALAAGNAVIRRVEVSADGGKTWQAATFDSEPKRWVWALWSCELDLANGAHTLIVRAHDSDGATQPERPADIWNFRGYQNNAWHRIKVNVG